MLKPEELDRLKWELGVTPIRIGAEPYIAYQAIWDRVIQPYLFDNTTTSTTTVVANAAGGIVTLTLASNPNAASGNGLTFQIGTTIVVDLGPAQETAVITALTGLNASVTLFNAHSGTYQVAPYGSEQLVRDLFARLDVIKTQLTQLAPVTAGIEKADDVSLSPAGYARRGKTLDKFQSLIMQREQARDDLGELVGFPNLRSVRRNASNAFEIY